MAKYHDEIPEKLILWMLAQKLFWVASAPLSGDGKVNISPKSIPGTFHVINQNKVWYEDLTGSGSETIAHLRENGRITIMFTAFEGLANIVRLWGKGTAYEFGTPEYEALIKPEDRKPGSRAAIVVDVYKVGTSCGWAVPFYDFKAHRTALLGYAKKLENVDAKAVEEGGETDAVGMKKYWATKNVQSLDGLPSLQYAGNAETLPTSLPGAGRAGITLGGVDVKPGGADIKVESKTMERREEARLLAAFAAGLMVAALYVKIVNLV